MSGRLIGGRYQLATILGQGGMGQVWTAYDQRLDRRVAVKLLRPDRVTGPIGSEAAGELRRRFVRECRVTAQVDHPGLVTVHDAGSDGEDLFLVMQYVEGADLADHLAEHDPYPWQWSVAVAAQLCAVLCAVHAVPIVHRDLKPRNVMVRPDGTVTVLDLGVASVLDTDTTRLTHTGSPIGSPAYMAPEQAMGGAVGPYTDLYALGVLLHELLSGDVPFAGSTALGVLHRHLYEPPLPVRRSRPEVPEALEALVLRLLAKDPQHRPSDAHHHVAGLEVAVDDRHRVHGGEHRAQLRGHGHGPLPGVRVVLRQVVGEVRALDVLHHQVQLVAVAAGVVDGDEARVVDLGGDPALAHEAAPHLARGGRGSHVVGPQELDGDPAVEPSVVRRPDLAHAALPDDRGQFVTAADDASVHRPSPSLRR